MHGHEMAFQNRTGVPRHKNKRSRTDREEEKQCMRMEVNALIVTYICFFQTTVLYQEIFILISLSLSFSANETRIIEILECYERVTDCSRSAVYLDRALYLFVSLL